MVDERLERKLARCERAWRQAKVKEAVTDAAAWCRRDDAAMPKWLRIAVREVDSAADTLGKRGRHAKPDGARKQDVIDFMRWDCVSYLRECKKESGDPRTFEKCYERASDILSPTVALGTARAMENSFWRVESQIRAGDELRYYEAWTDKRVWDA